MKKQGCPGLVKDFAILFSKLFSMLKRLIYLVTLGFQNSAACTN